MVERRQEVIDEGALHKYRTEIPNTIIRGVMGSGLTLPARWLYVYLKSVAGDCGECWQNMTTLAAGSRLSRGAVSNARKELIEAKLIVMTKGKGAVHETDRIRILDIWDQNMTEFRRDASSPHEQPRSLYERASSPHEHEEAAQVPYAINTTDARVHHMNTSSSPHELAGEISAQPSSPHEQPSSPHEPKKISLKKIPDPEETPSSSPNGEEESPLVDETGKPVASRVEKVKKPKAIAPLSPQSWVYSLLQEYTESFDVEALNDQDWWKDMGKSFPEFTREFVSGAFADLANWLRANPRRAPRNRKGWLHRMQVSLNFYYDNRFAKRGNSQGVPVSQPLTKMEARQAKIKADIQELLQGDLDDANDRQAAIPLRPSEYGAALPRRPQQRLPQPLFRDRDSQRVDD